MLCCCCLARRRLIDNLALIALLMGLFSALPVSAAFAAPSPQQLDALISKLSQPGAPGLSVAVFRAGKIIYRKATGLADLDHHVSLTTHSAFDIASMSKQFTAMAVVLLAEDRKLSLDDRVVKYLPELAPVADQITIRELLKSHKRIGIIWT